MEPLARETPSPRYDGPARAREYWRRNCRANTIRSAMRRSPSSCARWITACRGTARPGRHGSSRPGCAIPVHQQARPPGVGRGPAGHLRGHEEEGIDREFRNKGRQWREGKSPDHVQGHDFPGPPCRGPIPTACMTWPEQGFRERGDRPRHGPVRGGLDPGLVAVQGQPGVSPGAAILSRRTAGAATAIAYGCGRSPCKGSLTPPRWPSRCAISPRAPASGTRWSTAVLVHLLELARRTAAGLRDDRAPDRGYDDRQGVSRLLSSRSGQVSLRRKVTNEEMKRIRMTRQPFHGEWNYVIRPRRL